MERNILLTKLIMPKPRKNYIVREDLFRQLDLIQDRKLTVLKGLPGSGKTTLLTSYFQQRNKIPLWVSLDAECDDVLYFWSYLVKVLSGYLHIPESDSVAYLQPGAGTNIRELVRAVINSLDCMEDVYLALDDFHLIRNQDILESFEYFLGNTPDPLHVILLCREKPPLYLAKYEIQGELLYLDESSFKLSDEEGVAFLKGTLALQYSPNVLAELVKKAEGWIGGLQLLSAAIPREGPVASAYRTGQHNSPVVIGSMNLTLVHDYIAEEIFGRLQEGEQEFLVTTALPAYFNKNVTERVLPEVNYDELLGRLLAKNLMLQSVDEERGLYQYHSLFRDFLLTRFHWQDENLKKQLCHRIAGAFFEEKDFEEGLRLLYLTADHKQIMERLLDVPPGALQFAYMAKIPASEAVRNFDFAFQKFFYHYYMYEFDVCLDLHDAAMERISFDPKYMAFDGIKILFDQKNYQYGEELAFRADAEQICSLEVHSLTKALILMKQSALLFYQDQYTEALHFIEKSMDLVEEVSGIYVHYFNLTMKSQICEEMGLLNKALMAQEQIQKLFEQNKLLQELHTPTFCVTVAGFYLKQMRLSEAERILTACSGEIGQRGNQLQHSYEYNRIELLFLSGAGAEAMKALQELMATEAYGDILMVASLLKYACLRGIIPEELCDRFLSRYEAISSNSQTLNCRLLYARILSIRRQEERALAVLDEALLIGRKQASGLKIVEATLQKLTILMNRSKDTRKLVGLYKEAVYYACENGIRMPFFLEADTVVALQRQYGGQIAAVLSKPEQEFHEEMLKLCNTKENSILSEREQEILAAISDGLSNNEIAENLCISLATVKTHISNIFRKLEVRSRVTALEKARQTGLL